MAYNNTIAILIQARDEASGVIRATGANVESTANSLSKLGTTATAVGGTLTKAFTLPIAAVGLASVKMATDFQQSMELIRTQAGASQQEVDSLKESVLNLAPQVGQGPDKLAQALFYIESSGLRGAKALDVLKLSAEGANVGQADLADTANALTSTMNSQIKGAETATSAMGYLNAIVGAGKMHFQDLNEAISSGFLETAKLFGVSLDSVGSALATLTRVGEPAAQSATRLRMAMTLMAAPTQQAAKVLAGIGISADEVKASTSAMTNALADAHVTTNQLARDMQQPNGFNVAITDLRDHLVSAGLKSEEAAAVIARAFGGGRTSGPIMALVQDATDLNDTFAQITTTSGNFSDAVGAQNATAAQQFKDAWASVQVILIRFGDQILPTVAKEMKGFGDQVQHLTKWFSALSPAQKDMIIRTAEIVAVAGPALIMFGKFASAISAIGSTTMAVSKGLGGLFGLMKGAGSLSMLGGEAGLAAEGGAGLLATLGPVALGVGAVGLAAFGTYEFMKKFNEASKETPKVLTNAEQAVKDFDDRASKLGVTLHGTATDVRLTDLAHQHLADTEEVVTAASADLQKKYGEQNAVSALVVTASQKVEKAQDAVRDAYDKYGANSPQYQKAKADLAQVTEDLTNKQLDQWGSTLKVQAADDVLAQSENDLAAAKKFDWEMQDLLNRGLDAGVRVIKDFGPAADAQAPAIARLQDHIQKAIDSWTGLNISVQNGNPVIQGAIDTLNMKFQGLDAYYHGIEAQSIKLSGRNFQVNQQSPAYQGSYNPQSGGVNLQGVHALGTSYAPGGMSLLGEHGPELVDLPRGTRVYPAKQTQKLLKSRPITFKQTNHIYNNADMTAANRELGWRLAHA